MNTEIISEVTPGRDKRKRQRPKGYAPWTPMPHVREIIEQAIEVLHEYEDHLPLAGRQVFYRLVGNHGYEKTERAAKRLNEHLVRARRAGMIPLEHS